MMRFFKSWGEMVGYYGANMWIDIEGEWWRERNEERRLQKI